MRGRRPYLGAGTRAVHDGVASVQREGVLQLGQALREVVSGVDHPAIGLHEDRGAQVLVSVPPVARAAGTAAGAENTLIEAVLCGEKGQSGAHHGRDGCALS